MGLSLIALPPGRSTNREDGDHGLKERTSPEADGMAELREELPGVVSVIVPAYNAEKFIEKTISSVTHQTYGNIEVLVVDDGSQDRTAEIVEEIASRDRRVHLIRQANAGVAAARNRAIREARGQFVAPIDADDLWHPDKLALQVEALWRAPASVGVIYCWSVAIDAGDYVLSGDPVPFACQLQGNVFGELAARNFIGNGSVPLIRRRAIRDVGSYDPDLDLKGSEDWKLYIALAERYEYAVVPRALVGYRQVPGSLSMDAVRMERSWNVVTRWVRQRHPRLSRRIAMRQTYFGNAYFFQLALRRREFFRALRYVRIAVINDPVSFHLMLVRLVAARLRMRQAGGSVIGWNAWCTSASGKLPT